MSYSCYFVMATVSRDIFYTNTVWNRLMNHFSHLDMHTVIAISGFILLGRIAFEMIIR